MPAASSARFALRDATAAAHARVDAIFSGLDLADRDDYGRFLLAQAAAHLPVEQALEDGGIADVLPDWRVRRRSGAIRGDLDALGLDLPPPEPARRLAGPSELLGAAYVLEGSRLGGTVLKRSVPDALPTAFLSAGRPVAWRDMIAFIDARLSTREEISTAIAAACDVFEMFERSGRRLIG